MRVTQNMLYQTVLGGVQRNQERLLEYQTQVSTGKRIQKASDGPLDMARVLSYREMMSMTGQYQRNISHSKSWLSSTESALREGVDLLRSAKTLALQHANGTQNADTRAVAVNQVESIIDSMIRLGNTKVGDSYIFGGTRSSSEPFNPDGTYNGNRRTLTAEINQGVFQAYNLSGSEFLVADLDPVLSEPHSNTGKLAFETSGMAAGRRPSVSNWVLSDPADSTTYDLTVDLGNGVEHTVTYTTDASATQDELGAGLARAIEQDDELSGAVEAVYEGGVLTLTARTDASEAAQYRIRSATTPFSTHHVRFEGGADPVRTGFTLDSTNQSLVFSEQGFAAVNTIVAVPSAAVYSLEFQMGDLHERIELDYSGGPPPTQDDLGRDLADAINADTTLKERLSARYDAGKLVVAAHADAAGADSFRITQGDPPVFDPASDPETRFTLHEFTLTADVIDDSDAVRGVVYSGKELAALVAQAMENASAASGFSFHYTGKYDFVDDQGLLNRFSIQNGSDNRHVVRLRWSDPASTIRETLGFDATDSSLIAPGDADTGDRRVQFNVLDGVNDRFRINVDGSGFALVDLDAGAYTAEELADHIQSRIDAATKGVRVTYSEGAGGHFAIESQSTGMDSTIRLLAGEGADRSADFLRTIGFASEAGFATAASGSGAGVVDGIEFLNLEPFRNPSTQHLVFRYRPDGTWEILDKGDFSGLTVTSSDAGGMDLDFNGDGGADMRVKLSGWAAGDTLGLDLARKYRHNNYLDDGTDSVLLKDLNGGKGVRMEAPPVYRVVTGQNDQIRYTDESGTHTLVIPQGTYTGEELADAMEQAFNASGPSDYTVSYSDGRFSIQKGGGSLSLHWNDVNSTALGLLGFAAEQDTGALSYTGDYPVRTYHISVMDRAGNLARVDMAPFEVKAGQNTVSFNDGTAASFTIPPGYYTGKQLAAVIESRMEEVSAGGHPYTVAFRDGMFTITKDDGTPLTLFWNVPGSAADLLGFDSGSVVSGAASYTSSHVIPELTVNDVIERMNAEFASSGVRISARINGEGTGFELVDLNDPSDHIMNLRVFASRTAKDLGLFQEDGLVTIDAHTNVIYYTMPPGSGATFRATIQPGTYNGNDLARALKSALEQAVNVDNPLEQTTATFSVDYYPGRGVVALTPSSGMEIHWTSGPTASINGSTAAAVLGITDNWVFSGAGPFLPRYGEESLGAEGIPGDLTGTDLNPRLRGYTGVGDLFEGQGLRPGKIRIRNGDLDKEVDLTGSRTLRDIISRINASGAEVQVAFNSKGTALKLKSLRAGTTPVVSGDGDTAQRLGLSAGYDILETLEDFKKALSENDVEALKQVSGNLEAGLERMEDLLALTGSRIQNVEQTGGFLDKYTLDLKSLVADAEEVDITAAITRLLNQEKAFQAALQSAARLTSLSLLDFLK